MEGGYAKSPKEVIEEEQVVVLISEEEDLKKKKMGSSSPTIFSPNPPKTPLETTTPYRRSNLSKTKSRFIEPTVVATASSEYIELKKTPLRSSNSPYMRSPNNNRFGASGPVTPRTAPVTPRTPLMTPGVEEEEEDEEVYTSENVAQIGKKRGKKMKVILLLEWVVFIFIMCCLTASLTVDKLQHFMIWDLEIWKWLVLFMVILCGRLFAGWFVDIVVFLIAKNFFLKKRILYFVYGLRKSVQVFIWLSLVLLTWDLLFDGEVHRSRKANKALDYVSRALVCSLVGAAIWMVKTLLVKVSATSFHVSTFFDRIQESIFHQYVLQTLSGRPTIELAENIGSSKSGQLSFRSTKKKRNGRVEQEVIDVSKLHKLKQEKVSAWTMKGLVAVIRSSGLYTFSNTLEEIDDEGDEQPQEQEITNEFEAKIVAYKIFKNVAKPGNKHIDEEDLRRFLTKEEVDNVLPLFEGAVESGKIKKSTLKNWVVTVYLERKSLAYSLTDTKTAVKQLNKLIAVITLVVITIVWLLLMGLATTEVLLAICTQLLLVTFMFGNSAKIVFEAIIFVFIMHPFDVGDRCVIDGVQMIVEEMNILTTVFLRYDNEKIYYPNSMLATKSISNIYRSPFMGDGVEFSIDVTTTAETIGALKARIKMYIESKPKYWNPSHSVVVKEIIDVNKMQMALYVTHTMNFQNMGEKTSRRSDLVFELKNFFEELSIKYHLLPQEVQLHMLPNQQ